MVVTWALARSDVAAHPEVLMQRHLRVASSRVSRNVRIPRLGANDKIADLFRRSPRRQLVILGEPGAGKTALAVLLARQLLRQPETNDPIPVIVALTEWDPMREHLWKWFTKRVERDFPALRDHRRYGHEAAAQMVSDHMILPILDGLDEMPPSRHVAALTGIRNAAARGHPFALTSRTQEYRAAVASVGRVLPTAVVVEMNPVDAKNALDYLRHNLRPSDGKWGAVFRQIQQRPEMPLARAVKAINDMASRHRLRVASKGPH
jgi:hypothetical protein